MSFAYGKSKVLAEKAVWNFVEERKKKNLPCFEVAVRFLLIIALKSFI